MPKQLIKAVLFDYGGVIAEEGFRNGLLAMAREQGLDTGAMLDVAREAVYQSGFVLGHGSEREFWQSMRAGTGLEGSDAVLTKRILNGFVLRPWMIELVRRLHEQAYTTGILSDQTHWLDWLDARDHFFQFFDHIYNSYHMGKGKRDPGLFHDIARQLALSPTEILFVDDISENISRAHSAGWHVIHYVDRTRFLEAIDALLQRGQ